MIKKQILGIIDGDSLCYLSSKESLPISLKTIDDLIVEIINRTKITHYYMFLSDSPYYRHIINQDYKTRPKGSLIYLKTLKAYLKEHYLAESWKGVEADDAVAYVQNKVNNGEIQGFTKSIVCAMDKDVIKTTIGTIYNYQKREFINTNPDDASNFLFMQAIHGDSGDTIKGIPGVGPVKAAKLLDVPKEHWPLATFKAYLDHYKEPGQAVYEFQKNFRQVYMLKTDTDFMNEVGYIPELKTPILINT